MVKQGKNEILLTTRNEKPFLLSKKELRKLSLQDLAKNSLHLNVNKINTSSNMEYR